MKALACPTCDRTLQLVVAETARRWRWCASCGTLVTETGDDWREIEAPALVRRCAAFLALVNPGDLSDAQRGALAGVREAAGPP